MPWYSASGRWQHASSCVRAHTQAPTKAGPLKAPAVPLSPISPLFAHSSDMSGTSAEDTHSGAAGASDATRMPNSSKQTEVCRVCKRISMQPCNETHALYDVSCMCLQLMCSQSPTCCMLAVDAACCHDILQCNGVFKHAVESVRCSVCTCRLSGAYDMPLAQGFVLLNMRVCLT